MEQHRDSRRDHCRHARGLIAGIPGNSAKMLPFFIELTDFLQ